MIWSNGHGFEIELSSDPSPDEIRAAFHPCVLLSAINIDGVVSVIEQGTEHYLELRPLTKHPTG